MTLSGTQLVSDGPARDASGLVHRVGGNLADAPRPTLVLLHGRHGDEDGMWALRAAFPAGWLWVSPRAPFADAVAGHDWRPPGRPGLACLAEFEPAVTAIARFVAAMPELYGSDPRAIWLMGFSQGAAAALAVAIARPGLVRGVAGVVGFAPASPGQSQPWRPLRGLPVFLAAGRHDPVIPLAVSRASAATLSGLGAELTYREYNAGHRIPSQGIRDLGAWWARQGLGRRS